MATRGRIQYQADGEHLIKGAKTFDIHPDLLEKIEEAGGGAIDTVKVNGVTQPITNKTVNITVPVVEDSLSSYSTTNALSANQGRVLYDAIQSSHSIGRFLSVWDCTTGLPTDNPTIMPYNYLSGDYYIVGTVGATNYRPDGTQYTGSASTVVETETVAIDDFYFYNGINWALLKNSWQGAVIDTALSTTSTNAVENRVITNALNNKADKDDLDDYYTKTETDDRIEAELQDAVKDGVTTIQKNGTDQGTISANQATNKTINITMNKIDVGLENVDNTSDLNKPISTATQAALDLKADKTELNDYYKKTETYNKTEVDDKLDLKADKTELNDYYKKAETYTKTEVNTLLDDKADKSTTYTKTEVNALLDDKADKSTTYTKTEVDTLLNDKQDKLTTGSGISITNKVISNTGVLTVNGDSGTVVVNDVKKSATAPANPTEGTVWYDTTNDILKTYDGTAWNEVGAGNGDIKYEDFEFATMTGTVIENISATKSISADTTLTAGSSLKEGMQYLVRVSNTDTAPHNITFGGDSIEVGANETKSFVFLATSSSTLELQVCEGGGGGQTITIDTALSTTSTNPVQNKVITEKIDELELGVVVHSSTAPASASEGMLWYDTTNKILKIYNGTSWENVGSNGDYIEILSGSPVVKKYEWIGTEAQFLALGTYRADTEYKIY